MFRQDFRLMTKKSRFEESKHLLIQQNTVMSKYRNKSEKKVDTNNTVAEGRGADYHLGIL